MKLICSDTGFGLKGIQTDRTFFDPKLSPGLPNSIITNRLNHTAKPTQEIFFQNLDYVSLSSGPSLENTRKQRKIERLNL